MALLRDDPRWARLNNVSTPCPCCGMLFEGLPALGTAAPAGWSGPVEIEANEAVLSGRRPLLTEDFCLVEDGQFIRCVLELPLIGGEGAVFEFGVWSSVSQENFDIYVNTMDDGAQGGLGPWFGWFSTDVTGFTPSRGLKCLVHPQDGGVRPLIKLEPTDHPLAIAQRDGITLDRALDVLAACGLDLRSHLVAH